MKRQAALSIATRQQSIKSSFRGEQKSECIRMKAQIKSDKSNIKLFKEKKGKKKL
jgi:hypothetical protein